MLILNTNPDKLKVEWKFFGEGGGGGLGNKLGSKI